MDFSNIRNHRPATLEQACERYAIMAFELLNRRLAIGIRSIKYSYNTDKKNPAGGTFTGTFIPWASGDCESPWEDQHVEVTWRIEALANGKWRLYEPQARVEHLREHFSEKYWTYPVFWSSDRKSMRFDGFGGGIANDHPYGRTPQAWAWSKEVTV